MGSSCVETSSLKSRDIGVDGSSIGVAVAEDSTGSEIEVPAATRSVDPTRSSSTSHMATVNSNVANCSSGSCKAGLISVQSSSFRWGEDGEGQVAESKGTTSRKIAVPDSSRSTKTAIYKDANTDGTQERVNWESNEAKTSLEGQSGGVDTGGVTVGSPAVASDQDRPHEAGEIEGPWSAAE